MTIRSWTDHGRRGLTRMPHGLKRYRRYFGPHVAKTLRLIPERLLPLQARLKLVFDQTTFQVSPSRIRTIVLNEGRLIEMAGRGPGAAPDKYFRGLWKNAQVHPSRLLAGRFLLPGSWERAAEPFDDHHSFEVMSDIMERGDPTRSREYLGLIADVERGDFRYTKGCRTVADVEKYFAELSDLLRAIQLGGYRAQGELGGAQGDEIRVLLGRGGEPIAFGGGTHRLAIAQLLELPKVPVVVKGVHMAWAGSKGVLHAEDAVGALRRQVVATLGATARRRQ